MRTFSGRALPICAPVRVPTGFATKASSCLVGVTRAELRGALVAEYEKLVDDLFGEVLGMRFERFGPGGDQGIDLRHVPEATGPDVIQVKHYLGSSWSDLKKAAREERRRLGRLDPAPATYRFVTSQSLTPSRKDTLVEVLGPFVAGAGDIYGGEEVDDLLDHHGEVERRHPKLWLASASGLRAMVQANVHARSRQLAAEIEQKLPL